MPAKRKASHLLPRAVPGGESKVRKNAEVTGTPRTVGAPDCPSGLVGLRKAPGDSDIPSATRPVEKNCLTILVADDHPLVRAGLVAVINRQPGMRVVAEASNGREATEQFGAYQPDLALLDLRMPLMDGIEAASAIHERKPDAKIVIVSSYESEEEVYRSMRAGAQGYLLKDAPLSDLIECIQALVDGRTWIPPGVGAKLAKRVTGQQLTPREMQVLRTMVTGKSNKEIAATLAITESTVKVHVTHLLDKLKASGRTEAINVALKRGLVTIDPVRF